MKETKVAPSKYHKTTIGIMGLLVLFAVPFLCWMFLPVYPVTWNVEDFWFDSGQGCYVFIEPKLVIFLGDDDGEVFDNIMSHGNSSFGGYKSRYGYDNNFLVGVPASTVWTVRRYVLLMVDSIQIQLGFSTARALWFSRSGERN